MRQRYVVLCPNNEIFQLTHSRGVRHLDLMKRLVKADFNSRTHVECDQPYAAAPQLGDLFQLTHSRGVRHEEFMALPTEKDFNSRTHVECDRVNRFCIRIQHEFQLTHSRGVRPSTSRPIAINFRDFNSRTHVECDESNKGAKINKHKNFNSRTHVECDLQVLIQMETRQISTHALTWSATF